MSIGSPELALTLVLAVGLHWISRWRRSLAPSLLVVLLVSVFCLFGLGASLFFPHHRGLAVGFLAAVMATGVLGGLWQSSLAQGRKR